MGAKAHPIYQVEGHLSSAHVCIDIIVFAEIMQDGRGKCCHRLEIFRIAFIFIDNRYSFPHFTGIQPIEMISIAQVHFKGAGVSMMLTGKNKSCIEFDINIKNIPIELDFWYS